MKIISAIVDEMPTECALCRFYGCNKGKEFCKLNYKAIRTIHGGQQSNLLPAEGGNMNDTDKVITIINFLAVIAVILTAIASYFSGCKAGYSEGRADGMFSGRYAWHDLRKDPKDFPKMPMQVLIVMNDYNYAVGEYWGEQSGWGETPSEVIGWKYIESFEEADND